MRRGQRRDTTSARPRARRLGLQTRVILAFAIGAALVSGVLAVSTFYLVRRELVSQRMTSVLRQTFVNARLVKVELGAPSAKVGDVLSSLTTTRGTRAFIYRHGLWYSNSATITGTAIPASLRNVVLGGKVADQRVDLRGVPTAIVGVPIPALGVTYFEEHPLTDLTSTLGVLGTVVTGVAIATTVAGALCGWWATRRLVRPLGHVMAVAADITEGSLDRRLPDDRDLRPLVTAFNEMVGALQSRIERDARFASDVSHELRSPLTTIGASVELLGSWRSTLPRDGMLAFDTLQVEVDRFSQMIEDLLEMAAIDAGAATVHFTDVPLCELVRRTVAGYDPSIPVDVGPGADGSGVRGDKRRLQQVLVNLLDNAETHAHGAVAVRVAREGPTVTVAVDDDGPGIPFPERDHVFERFYRGAASGRRSGTGGTGLGLALVAEHVRVHGGTVRIDESQAGGARVEVVLPVHDVLGTEAVR
jgi:two-component system sensor histidine kinase MtrB